MTTTGRKPRILLIGNIAQNGYLLTKFLRRAGWDAELLIYSYTHLMGQPEWEDAAIRGNPPHWDADWKDYLADDYRRPEWVHEIRVKPHDWQRRLLVRLRLARQFYCWRGHRLTRRRRSTLIARFQQRFGQQRGPLLPGDIDYALAYCNYPGIPPALVRRFDLLIGTGLDATLPMLLAPGKPYLALEHGTMRELPLEDSSWGRMLALAYDQAAACIITNPDCIATAQKLGLPRCRFMPHPIDDKYLAPDPGRHCGLDPQCREGDGPLVFAPARHDWAIKGNQVAIDGFARFVASGVQKNARLLLLEWGADLSRSRALIDQRGIADRVLWRPVLSGRSFCDAIKAADVVLDQFVLGVFGSTVPQALAAGKPVVSSYDDAKNQWAFPVPPPLCRAATADEVAGHLGQLFGDAEKRRQISIAARAWFDRYHSPDRVVAILAEMLESAHASSPARADQRGKSALGALAP